MNHHQCKSCSREALPNRDVCFDCDQAVRHFTGVTTTQWPWPPTGARITGASGLDRPSNITDKVPYRSSRPADPTRASDRSLAQQYPQYYKPVGHLKEVDVYAVCSLFPVNDPSGCINHARKKLLIPGVRTGGKSMHKDVREAIDSLNRWLQLNPETKPAESA